MKRFKWLFVLTLLLMGGAVRAQVPAEMQYQLLVLQPSTGQVRTNARVGVRLELRRDSAGGQAVWSHDYDVTTDAQGFCQLTLDFGQSVDWGKEPYYLAVTVDGEDGGAPKLTSVPYAFCASRLEGTMSREELIGTWQGKESDPGYVVYDHTYVFNADGTGRYSRLEDQGHGYQDTYGYAFRWTLLLNGHLLIEKPHESSAADEAVMRYVRPVVRLSATEIMLTTSSDIEVT